jgi:hypothetical protein
VPPKVNSAASPVKPDSDADFVVDEVNPILDKINAQGIQSLTDRERKILERAYTRMNKR